MKALLRWLHHVENGILAGLLAAMLGIALYQIVGRNLFGTALLWGDQAVRLLVLWLTFLGALAATRSGEHIRIDLLARFLPPQALAVTTRLAALGAAVVTGLFAWHAYLVKLVENFWCPFHHARKSTYAEARYCCWRCCCWRHPCS